MQNNKSVKQRLINDCPLLDRYFFFPLTRILLYFIFRNACSFRDVFNRHSHVQQVPCYFSSSLSKPFYQTFFMSFSSAFRSMVVLTLLFSMLMTCILFAGLAMRKNPLGLASRRDAVSFTSKFLTSCVLRVV